MDLIASATSIDTVMMPEKKTLAKVYFVSVYPNKAHFYILFRLA